MDGKFTNKTVNIIGVQSDSGASMRGSDLGADAIRGAGLTCAISEIGYKICDCGNIASDIADSINNSDKCKCGCAQNSKNSGKESVKELKNLDAVNSVNTRLYDLVKKTLTQKGFPLVLGGDHSLSAGSIMAAANYYGKIGVIWVDAHGDFNSLASSPSGNIHGMPLSAVTGNGPDEILPFKEDLKNSKDLKDDSKMCLTGELKQGLQGGDKNCFINSHNTVVIGGRVLIDKNGFVSPNNTVIIGARELDNEERIRLKQAGITVFTMREVDTLGMAAVAAKAVEVATSGTDGLYLSFDLDALDPSLVADVGTPAEGGLSFREGRLLCETIAESGKLIGLDMVELNPIAAGKNSITVNKSAEVAVKMICSALGSTLI